MVIHWLPMRTLLPSYLLLVPLVATAAPRLDVDFFGDGLGGWNAKKATAAEYKITGVDYRTWKPHVTPTADGGLFVSLRIDHLRGLLASDDHASLELSFDKEGEILSARSTIALQGRKITSDLVRGSAELGIQTTAADRMVKMGTDLVADLTAKLLREKVNEAGRVGFPAALQHNYHLVCLAVSEDVDRRAVVVRPASPGEAGEAAPANTGESSPGSSTAEENPGPAPKESGPEQKSTRTVPPLTIEEPGQPLKEKAKPIPGSPVPAPAR
jgi:hypothetical protein